MPFTRAQLDALTALHRYGRLVLPGATSYSQSPGPRPHRRTHEALWAAGLATPGTSSTTPLLDTYLDTFERWRVAVPATIPESDRAAVARAVIAGEIKSRRPTRPGWRPRVRAEDTIPTMSTAPGAPTHYVYREV